MGAATDEEVSYQEARNQGPTIVLMLDRDNIKCYEPSDGQETAGVKKWGLIMVAGLQEIDLHCADQINEAVLLRNSAGRRCRAAANPRAV